MTVLWCRMYAVADKLGKYMKETIPMAWSYSSMKDFSNCPRKFNEIKVKKNYEFKKTEAIIYGEEVHKALELYISEGKEVPERYSQFRKIVETLNGFEGEKHTELKLGLNGNRKPCEFFAKEVWVRGVVDLLIINGKTAYVIDYKTGNDKYADTAQLKLMAIMAFEHFPQIEKIKAALLFIVKDRVIKERYNRDDLPELWARFEPNLYKLRQAFATDVWNPNPTGLCRFCPVKTCEYNPDH